MFNYLLAFNPENFAKNLPYMGRGMLGIFIVIGIIIGITYLLNFLTAPKKKDDKKEDKKDGEE